MSTLKTKNCQLSLHFQNICITTNKKPMTQKQSSSCQPAIVKQSEFQLLFNCHWSTKGFQCIQQSTIFLTCVCTARAFALQLQILCVCANVSIVSLLLFRDNREANFNKSKPFHFLHLQADSLFQQGELSNKSHPRRVRLILFDNSFMKAHPVGYCPAIAIQKHKARRCLSPAPFLSQLNAYLRVAKSKQGQIVSTACLCDNAMSLQLPHISHFCASYTNDSQRVQLKCSCKKQIHKWLQPQHN